MKVKFDLKDRDKILANIKKEMGGRQLSEIVDFALDKSGLTVTISKMGTSTLTFSESEEPTGFTYNLTKEKIAFQHKMFKDEVTRKILDVIKKAGGKVT